jgi:hypothetical protein
MRRLLLALALMATTACYDVEDLAFEDETHDTAWCEDTQGSDASTDDEVDTASWVWSHPLCEGDCDACDELEDSCSVDYYESQGLEGPFEVYYINMDGDKVWWTPVPGEPGRCSLHFGFPVCSYPFRDVRVEKR